jgi:hypothetical protein
MMALLAFLAREHRTDVPEYLPEPPDDAPPALAYGLVTEGADTSRAVLATLLDLVDRGFYETKPANADGEKLDIAIKAKPREGTDSEAGLTRYEKDVLKFFDDVVDSETVPLSKLRDRVPEHSDVWRGRWRNMTDALDEADEGALGWDRDLNPARGFLALGVIAAFAVLTIAYISVEEKFLLPVALGILTLIGIFAVPSRRLRRIDRVHRERSAKWSAFAHWTEDFPRLQDDPPQTLELWKRIMVYGVVFGTAERMIKSGRIPEPVLEASSAGGGWTAYAFADTFGWSSFNGSAFSSGFSSQVAPEASSGGGGGGFSGGFSGGGSFGGGGGGGAW